MSLRMIEIFLEGSGGELVEEVLEDYPLVGLWHHETSDNSSVTKVLLDADKTDAVLDQLERHFGQSGGFRTVLMSVEATLPRPEAPRAEAVDEETEEDRKPKIRGSRLGREELYADVEQTARLSWVFVTMVVLSTIVAAIGLLKDSVAVIIGAMVIAPLLGPNVALALATALGDSDLGRRSVTSGLVGVLIALVISAAAGYLFTIDPGTPEMLARTRVDLGDVLLALASGSAGALAFTTGVAASLIGVMVAVALLPPLVTVGLMLGSGHYELALGASLLLGTNVICVNLSGVVTFLAQRVRPNTWWEADKAKRATRIAIALWTLLLLVLAAIVVASQNL